MIELNHPVSTIWLVTVAVSALIGASARECWEKELRPWWQWIAAKAKEKAPQGAANTEEAQSK